MFTSLVVCSIIGIAVLGSGNNTSSVQVKRTCTDKYSKEWFRNELPTQIYDNWNIDDITYQMRDNWNRQEFERLERNGYSTRYAIEHMIEHNNIKL